uniref:Uncharacterized protein n=1 Tax=Plectus sambesii TaxID=2011161 RepID=A0A914WFZ2_9BILA
MSTSGKLLFLVITIALVVIVLPAPAPESIFDDIDNVVEDTVRKFSKYCGNKLCSESSPFHYYECCGDILSTKCCLRLQDWVIPAAVGVGVFLLGACVASCFQCR